LTPQSKAFIIANYKNNEKSDNVFIEGFFRRTSRRVINVINDLIKELKATKQQIQLQNKSKNIGCKRNYNEMNVDITKIEVNIHAENGLENINNVYEKNKLCGFSK